MKYEALKAYLFARPQDDDVTLTFDDIEKLVGTLPESAEKWPAQWWANTATHSHAEAWLGAGRRVVNVDVGNRTVTFSKREAIHSLAVRKHQLRLGDVYTRSEIHAIFNPESELGPKGAWAYQGILPVPDSEGSFLFLVTWGASQGDHTFEEAVSSDGVISWQSQPKQRLSDAQIINFIHHDHQKRDVHLFLRTGKGPNVPYWYCGTLAYLSHDEDLEQPVHFRWQLLDWAQLSDDVRGHLLKPHAFPDVKRPTHLLIRWRRDGDAQSDLEHAELAETMGRSVFRYWGGRQPADRRITELNGQVADGIATYVYLWGGAPEKRLYRARLMQAVRKLEDIGDTAFVPASYRDSVAEAFHDPDAEAETFFWLYDFEQLDAEALDNILQIADKPDSEGSISNALTGQAGFLYVWERSESGSQAPKETSTMLILNEGLSMPYEYIDADLVEGLFLGPLEAAVTVGSRSKGIARGTRVLLVRSSPGSIALALGRTISAVHEGQWSNADPDEWHNFLDVTWEAALPGSAHISLDSLNAMAPEVDWIQVPREGVEVSDAVANTLANAVGEAWEPIREAANEIWDNLVEATSWEEERLAALIGRLSGSSPQAVLAGPPGTGKTYVARKVADYLVKASDLAQAAAAPSPNDAGKPSEPERRTHLVQFHPSYGYEEFVEGLQPRSSENGGFSFELVPGVIRKLAEAVQTTGKRHVLVIDEMNRANLPRVFGELLFLLEYRNETIDLAHSGSFSLPSGLVIIGTMNTADRGAQSVDYALRRRFEFFDVAPDAEVLRAFYDENPNWLDDVLFTIFAKLNARLTEAIDRHHTVGHSYFMTDEMNHEVLRGIWERQIFPLIEEYFFDQPDVVAEYSLEALSKDD